MNGGIDLHMHTKYSDGTDSETELLERLRREGINFFAVTDHDTIEGAMRVKNIVPEDMKFVAGIEFSCKTVDGGKVHILGYGYDENNSDFRAAIDEGRKMRAVKLEGRLEHLKNDHGIIFSDEDYDYIRSLTSSGKPHLAALLVKRGYAADKKSAIEKYIDDKNGMSASTRIPSENAMYGIAEAGGIPVWAHPLGGINERHLTEEEFDTRLKVLMNEGLRGLECWYSLYNESEISFLVKRAEENGLLISGGSDYHGKNKRVSPGELNAFGKAIDKEELSLVKELNFS